MRTRRLLHAVIVLVSLGAVTACTSAPEPRLTALPPVSATIQTPDGTVTPSPAPTTSTAGGAQCIDGVLSIAGSDQSFAYDGSCARVEISGAHLEIDLERADVTGVSVRGDDIEVDAAAVTDLLIEGQDNDIDLDQAGSVAIRGDRNGVDVSASLPSLTIDGNDNEVDAPAVVSTDIRGARNDASND